MIFWNEDDDGEVSAICVMDIREQELQDQLSDIYENSSGADTAGWLDCLHPMTNPAGLFAHLLFRRKPTSPSVQNEIIRDFSRIHSAHWAREMLAVIEMPE